jgi:DNA-binding MarR family transcriptional regulator
MTNGCEAQIVLSFAELGLNEVQAQVLACVVGEGETTAADLAATTGKALSSLSVAVQRLVQLGLLQRVPGRRPSVIFLHPEAGDALAGLAAGREREREAQRAREAEALSVLAAAAARRTERGRPQYELEPRLRIETGPAQWPRRQGRLSHSQVLPLSELRRMSVPLSGVGCPTRILVCGVDGTPGVKAEISLQAAERQQPGAEVRTTDRSLPSLWLLDGERVAVTAGTAYGERRVWSRDQLLVRAAQDLFEQWWVGAPLGAITPKPPARPEVDLVVEEWDPDELSHPDELSDTDELSA